MILMAWFSTRALIHVFSGWKSILISSGLSVILVAAVGFLIMMIQMDRIGNARSSEIFLVSLILGILSSIIGTMYHFIWKRMSFSERETQDAEE